jgi:hypothetical protein
MATEKQKKAFDELRKKRGKKQEAMLSAGYSKVTAKTPNNLTKSKGFRELIEKAIPDKRLAKKHKTILDHTDFGTKAFPKSIPDDVIHKLFKKLKGYKIIAITESKLYKYVTYIKQDVAVQKDMLDMAYKVKGHYAPIKFKNEDPLSKLTDEEIEEILQSGDQALEKLKNEHKRRITREGKGTKAA